MSDAGFLVAVMDLMGHRERDGHSGAWAMAQAGTVLYGLAGLAVGLPRRAADRGRARAV